MLSEGADAGGARRPRPAIGFEPFRESHVDLLHSWLQQPHVARWWGDPDVELALVRDETAAGLTEGYMVLWDERPTAFIQSYDPADDGEPWTVGLPPVTRGIDFLIGPVEMTGKGIGPKILSAFAARLFDQGADMLVIDPEESNIAAIRAYEKAGFVPFGTHEEDGKTAILMRMTPDGAARRP